MNFKTANIYREVCHQTMKGKERDRNREGERERGEGRTTEQEISMAANVMNNISSVNPAN